MKLYIGLFPRKNEGSRLPPCLDSLVIPVRIDAPLTGEFPDREAASVIGNGRFNIVVDLLGNAFPERRRILAFFFRQSGDKIGKGVIQKMERMVLTVVQASELQTVVPIDPLSIKCFASKEVINPWRYGDFYY